MTQDAILGLDIGTTSTKAVLFDLSGNELATAQQSYPLSTPQAGWAEQDPEELWRALVSVLRAVVSRAGSKRRILALTLAAQSGSLIPTRDDGDPIYPMITWLDKRAEALVKQWQAEGLEKMVRPLSGWLLQPGLPLPNIAWLRQFKPHTFAKAGRFLGLMDFLNHRLTGQFCADLSSGTEMQLIDVTTGQWSPQLCNLAGITPDHLSRLEPSGTVIGSITPETSRLTGLSVDTLVISGGHDQCCTALAMGMISPGKLMLASGTAWVITAITDSPLVEAVPANMDLNFHVAPNLWTVSQLLGGFGASIEWWLNQNLQSVVPETALTRVELYTHLNNILSQSQPGCNKLLFLPPGWGAQLSATASGGGFIGLRLDHSRADMGRAILEGIAFELRWALENIQQAGLPVEQLWIVGGATQSPVWPQILADVSGASLLLTRYAHWPALGAAILAGVGAGIFDTLEAGIARFQKSPRQIAPDESYVQLYSERFTAYKQVAQCLALTPLNPP